MLLRLLGGDLRRRSRSRWLPARLQGLGLLRWRLQRQQLEGILRLARQPHWRLELVGPSKPGGNKAGHALSRKATPERQRAAAAGPAGGGAPQGSHLPLHRALAFWVGRE